MVDVLFDNHNLKLTVSCEAEILLKTVLQNHTEAVFLKSEKYKKIGDLHHHFACILRHHDNPTQARLIEDFEVIEVTEDARNFIEVVECPLKYEFFRRPCLIFKRGTSFIHCKDYTINTHESSIQDYFNSTTLTYKSSSGRELRLKSRLNWAMASKESGLAGSCKKLKTADFLLKFDPKLGGVLMYNTNSKSECQISYFIFAILSECDVCFQLPNKSAKSISKPHYMIIFKPKKSTTNYDYLSINKDGTLKAIMMESRSEFVAWLSGLRLAKHSQDLSMAYRTNIRPKNTVGKVVVSSKSFKSKALLDLGTMQTKVKGLSHLMRFKTKSLSCSEDSLVNSSMSQLSTWSMLSSSEGSSSAESPVSGMMFKKPKPACAMLSDQPIVNHDFIDDHEFEEPDFVPVDMSTKGCEIITDPTLVKQVEQERALRAKFRKGLPFSEPWFSAKSRIEVEHLLLNFYHIDGYFLVRSDFCGGENVALVLSYVHNETLFHQRIIQKSIFNRCVFCLDDFSSLNFPTVASLVDFYKLNVAKPLPCFLTESPIMN